MRPVMGEINRPSYSARGHRTNLDGLTATGSLDGMADQHPFIKQ